MYLETGIDYNAPDQIEKLYFTDEFEVKLMGDYIFITNALYELADLIKAQTAK
jgi:hypothetical protein